MLCCCELVMTDVVSSVCRLCVHAFAVFNPISGGYSCIGMEIAYALLDAAYSYVDRVSLSVVECICVQAADGVPLVFQANSEPSA